MPRPMPDHGTRGRYVAGGCRCDDCRQAVVEYNRIRRHARKRREAEAKQWDKQINDSLRGVYDVISVPEGDTSWMPSAACRNEDTETFFPPKGSGNRFDKAAALRVCASCGVRKACLDYALRTNQQEGIWGMTTPHERLTMRRQVAS